MKEKADRSPELDLLHSVLRSAYDDLDRSPISSDFRSAVHFLTDDWGAWKQARVIYCNYVGLDEHCARAAAARKLRTRFGNLRPADLVPV